MSDTTVVHLLRHGEVSNPRGVLYGRLPGYHLSEEGRLMAKAATAFLAGRDVMVLRSSPLERALETAAPVAAQFGLDVQIDERLIEPWNHFEGTTFGVGDGALRRPANWRHLRGHEAVLVSHQLPIWVARRQAENRPLWHHPGRRRCALASVTSFTYHGDTIDGISYAEPAGAGRPQVPGA
jgi:broad specificity phosphatase PhoE